MSITKFNKVGKREFEVDLKAIKEWKKAKDLIGKPVVITAIGTHKSSVASYADSVFAVAKNGYGINLPSWFGDTVKEVLYDSESVEQIKNGTVAVKFSPYKTKNGTTTVNVEFVDLTDIDSEELPF